MKFYAVKRGRKTGIFTTWEETENQVKGYPGAKHKSFKTREEAEAYLGGKTGDSTKSAAAFQPEATTLDLGFDDEVRVYTDGGSRTHGNKLGEHVKSDDKAAWAYLILAGGERLSGTGGEHGATNNRMEIMALLKAVEKLAEKGWQNKQILVVSDSRYVLNAVTKGWLKGWRRRGWKRSGGPLVNKELWQQLDAQLEQFSNINYKWTKGHADNDGNVFVDELLNKTMDKMTDSVPDSEVADSEDESDKSDEQETQAPDETEKADNLTAERRKKKSAIRLETRDIKPETHHEKNLPPRVKKSVADLKNSLRELGLWDK